MRLPDVQKCEPEPRHHPWRSPQQWAAVLRPPGHKASPYASGQFRLPPRDANPSSASDPNHPPGHGVSLMRHTTSCFLLHQEMPWHPAEPCPRGPKGDLVYTCMRDAET